MVSLGPTTPRSVPPDRPDKQAADRDEQNRERPFVNEPLNRKGDLLCRRSFYHGFLDCIALHQTDSAVCGLAAWGDQDLIRQALNS